jgi:vacuolar-type H+-ATPase subunit F/Vma7
VIPVSRVAVIGEDVRVEGFGLAGALVCPAYGETAVRAAWDALEEDVSVVLLTPAAAAALAGVAPGSRLTAVMPP